MSEPVTRSASSGKKNNITSYYSLYQSKFFFLYLAFLSSTKEFPVERPFTVSSLSSFTRNYLCVLTYH